MYRYRALLGLIVLALVWAGCGGSYSGVMARAPGIDKELASTVRSPGEYSLFRGAGFMENHDPHVEQIWTVKLDAGQKIGFRWVNDNAHTFEADRSLHLVAFAGNETRDLGTYKERDVKYVWAGAKASGGLLFGIPHD